MTQNSSESLILGRSSWQIGFIFHLVSSAPAVLICSHPENRDWKPHFHSPWHKSLTSTRTHWQNKNVPALHMFCWVFFYIYIDKWVVKWNKVQWPSVSENQAGTKENQSCINHSDVHLPAIFFGHMCIVFRGHVYLRCCGTGILSCALIWTGNCESL